MTILEERRKKIEHQISDENLRHIIFNYEDTDDWFLSSDEQCLDYFSNVMTFSVFLVWNAFLKWKKNINGRDVAGNNSFWRLYNMLDRICDPTKINGGIIDDVLINLEIDCLLDNDESPRSFVKIVGLDEFFNFSRGNNKLAKYIGLVKQNRISSRLDPQKFNFDTFCSAIKLFPYLRDAKVFFSDIDGLYKGNPHLRNLQSVSLVCSEIGESLINTVDFYQSILINGGAVYYMEDFSVEDAKHFDTSGNKNQLIAINYMRLDASNDKFTVFVTDDINYSKEKDYAIKTSTAIEEFLLNYDIINTYKSGVGSIFFRDYILLNNRYLKELSYTISDALSVHLKETIRARYPQYKEIFDKMYATSLYDKNGIAGYRWDEIVLFLLLEEGVQEFFRVLLYNGGTYTEFVKSFARRLGNEKVDSILNTDKLHEEELKKRLPPGSSKYAEIDCLAKALIMLATKALTQNDWAFEESFYPTTIDNIISECKKVYLSQFSKQEKVIYFSNIILQVIHFIIKFYNGVFKYATEKKKYKEKEVFIKSITTADNDDNPETINRYFSSNPVETAEKVKKAFEQLIALNSQTGSCNDFQGEIPFETLGRKYLFSSDKMQLFGDKIFEILSFPNSTVEELYEKVKQFLLYLKTGMDDAQRETVHENQIEMAIYPIVGQYCSGVTSFDGYRYSLFRISPFNNSEDSHVITIKMITDDEFDFGHSYYCIPNINRIADVKQGYTYDKIWVSPIIIPCSAFSSQFFSNLERLSDEKDFAAAIELIYESDPFIYKDLFDSLENAKAILPGLLDNPDSKFFKDHYRIIRKDKEIVAIASLYSYSNFFYEDSLIVNEANKTGIKLPQKFEAAIKDLRNTFVDDYLGRNYFHIDDVCVKKNCRRQGLGRSLMMGILKEVERSNMSARLFVYSENHIAYRLYSSLGFFPIKNQFTVGNNKKYFQMVKV